MKIWGQVLIAVGALTVLLALSVMSVTVSGYGTGPVVNLELLQRQELFTHIGLAMFIAGAIFTTGGALQDTGTRDIAPAEVVRTEEGLHRDFQEPGADDDKRLWVIGGVVIAIVMAAVLYNAWSSTLVISSAAAVTEMNAEALADNMEMQADAMDAMADNLTATQ